MHKHIIELRKVLENSYAFMLVFDLPQEQKDQYVNGLTDLIYDTVDELIENNDLEALEYLLNINISNMDINLSLALLTASLPLKNNISNRPGFITKLEELLEFYHRENEGLLNGLK